ncbi:FAD binding domain-containing protein [Ilyonectria destructans]|nr:FAD binding domain-containing protein [Ilyonectria destructans]
MEDTVIEREFLIAGCGPAGASLACFLASHGLTGVMIGAAPGTANTSRAHITNVDALGFTGIDLEASWGDYESASPCEPTDVPQTLLEPILIRHLKKNSQRVLDFIGDNTPAEISSISKWFINETVAEKYSYGNMHPLFNGLGSNTCIQDAFNLAWKVAYVHRGLAPPSLLDTYSVERQPVSQSIITRSNEAFQDHYRIWEALAALLTGIGGDFWRHATEHA